SSRTRSIRIGRSSKVGTGTPRYWSTRNTSGHRSAPTCRVGRNGCPPRPPTDPDLWGQGGQPPWPTRPLLRVSDRALSSTSALWRPSDGPAGRRDDRPDPRPGSPLGRSLRVPGVRRHGPVVIGQAGLAATCIVVGQGPVGRAVAMVHSEDFPGPVQALLVEPAFQHPAGNLQA